MMDVQILYLPDASGDIDYRWSDEAALMHDKGFIVDTKISNSARHIIYRGTAISSPEFYPADCRFINSWEQNARTRFMSLYLPYISELSIPTFFADVLESPSTQEEITKRGWKKAFIKRDSKSLFSIGDNASIWPDTAFEWMAEQYEKLNIKGPYAVREYIDNKEIFYDEQRYWVLDGIAHHPSGIIPSFVQEAASRLYKFSGSRYFTIDVAGDYIVEVNPGESSDRGGDNPLEFFCNIFAKTFLDK